MTTGFRSREMTDHYIGPIQPLLDMPEVTEVCVNPDGTVWTQERGERFMKKAAVTFDENRVNQIGKQVGNNAAVKFDNARNPIVTADMAGSHGNARIQVVAAPACEGTGAIAIRKLGIRNIPLGSYAFSDGARVYRGKNTERMAGMQGRLEREDMPFPDLAAIAIDEKWNMLISGGTNSGKTSLTNAMLSLVPREERIVTIESVRELRLDQPNTVHLLSDDDKDKGRTTTKLMEAVLRLRPDRFIAGEIRGSEASDFLEIVNTGHPGSVCTMHANNPREAMRRLTKMVRRGMPGAGVEEIYGDIRQTIDMIVQIGWDGTERRIQSVFFPALMDRAALE